MIGSVEMVVVSVTLILTYCDVGSGEGVALAIRTCGAMNTCIIHKIEKIKRIHSIWM